MKLNFNLTLFIIVGLEEFEDKVDKIANGQDDESWIGQLYNQFSTNLGIDGGKIDDEDIGSMDGLEPPIIDEKWGLEDIRKLHEPEGNFNIQFLVPIFNLNSIYRFSNRRTKKSFQKRSGSK